MISVCEWLQKRHLTANGPPPSTAPTWRASRLAWRFPPSTPPGCGGRSRGPHEGGRLAVVCQGPDGISRDLLPMPWNARTRVHEYGGKSYLPLPGGFVFANFGDQRLYRCGVTDQAGAGPVRAGTADSGAGRGRRRPVRRLRPFPGRGRGVVRAGAARASRDGRPGRAAGSPARSWPSRWTARPRTTPPRSGSWSAVRTSTPTQRRRRTAPGWPGSAGTTPGCRGTAPNSGSRRSMTAGRSATRASSS